MNAEYRAKNSAAAATLSADRSKVLSSAAQNLNAELEALKRENAEYRHSMQELRVLLKESESRIVALEDAIPIKVIRKEKRKGTRGGASSWPIYMWDLILEQLVNGTPPTAVADNIQMHVKKFSPTTKIKALPSIWTIRRARTVLLVIVQTLAAYRLGKADKWVQLFTDATSRRQVTFQNLIISIEDDELFR